MPITLRPVFCEMACVIRPAGLVKLMNQASGATRSTIAGMLQSDRDGSQSHGGAARSGGLLAGQSMLDRDPFIPRAGGHATHADAVQNRAGAFDRAFPGGRKW